MYCFELDMSNILGKRLLCQPSSLPIPRMGGSCARPPPPPVNAPLLHGGFGFNPKHPPTPNATVWDTELHSSPYIRGVI